MLVTPPAPTLDAGHFLPFLRVRPISASSASVNSASFAATRSLVRAVPFGSATSARQPTFLAETAMLLSPDWSQAQTFLPSGS